MNRFFSKSEEALIIESIRRAEQETSGEIRVHLEHRKKSDSVIEGAKKAFTTLRMERTAERNGVLVYLIPSVREFAILGDSGINAKVPEHFWEDVRDVMQDQFRKGAVAQGICDGILLIGEKLKTYFPYQKDDTNELPDDLSYGSDSATE